MEIGILHKVLVDWFIVVGQQFFSDLIVNDKERKELPKGAAFYVSSHANASMDPLNLSGFLPGRPQLHYWAKSTLFKNPIVAKFLLAAGNIPVDRVAGDNQKLFSGTFDALKEGEKIAVFPEGGSFHEPQLNQFKDGASWSILEYSKNLKQSGATLSSGEKADHAQMCDIVIVGISYSDRTRFRSKSVINLAVPFDVRPHAEQFNSGPENEKPAVKRLTNDLRTAMLDVTVNAPSLDVLYAAQAARDIIYKSHSNVPWKDLRNIDQGLVNKLANAPSSLIEGLVTYRTKILPGIFYADHELVDALKDGVWNNVFKLVILLITAVVTLPLFLPPLLFFSPLYALGYYAAQKTADPVEKAMSATFVTFPLIIIYVPLVAVFLRLVVIPAISVYLPFKTLLALVSVYILIQANLAFVDIYWKLYRQIYLVARLLVEDALGTHAKEHHKVRAALDLSTRLEKELSTVV